MVHRHTPSFCMNFAGKETVGRPLVPRRAAPGSSDVCAAPFFVRTNTASLKCCMCGTSVVANKAAMCPTCLQAEVDITEGSQRSRTSHGGPLRAVPVHRTGSMWPRVA